MDFEIGLRKWPLRGRTWDGSSGTLQASTKARRDGVEITERNVGVAISARYSNKSRSAFPHVHACSAPAQGILRPIRRRSEVASGALALVACTRKRDPAPCREPTLLTRGRRTRSLEPWQPLERGERNVGDGDPMPNRWSQGPCPEGTLRRHTLDGAARGHGPARPRRGAWGLPTRGVPALGGFASTGGHSGQAAPASTAGHPGSTPRRPAEELQSRTGLPTGRR